VGWAVASAPVAGSAMVAAAGATSPGDSRPQTDPPDRPAHVGLGAHSRDVDGGSITANLGYCVAVDVDARSAARQKCSGRGDSSEPPRESGDV
jgi:hypothetical protein